jgi:hypothetical protein
MFAAGLAITLRFVYHYFTSFTGGGRYLQSLVYAAVLLIVGFQVLLIGLLADVISANRKLLEDLLYRVRRMELPETDDGRTEIARHETAEPAERWER